VIGVSMADLLDRHAPLDALWGPRSADLRHRLMSAADLQAMFRILEQSLRERIHRPLLLHPAVAHALSAVDGMPARVADVQRASGYSPRHFISIFRSAVGLNPKLYYRIRRFNSAVRSVAAGGCLSDIAMEAGYSDQAHMAREFRAFAGVAPTEYRPSAIDRPLHHLAGAQPITQGKKPSRHAEAASARCARIIQMRRMP
jgi:AraC-like DNA-binding protein